MSGDEVSKRGRMSYLLILVVLVECLSARLPSANDFASFHVTHRRYIPRSFCHFESGLLLKYGRLALPGGFLVFVICGDDPVHQTGQHKLTLGYYCSTFIRGPLAAAACQIRKCLVGGPMACTACALLAWLFEISVRA